MNGLVLMNVGTPDAPRPREVRRYLREFLGDPHVVDINPVGRWMLLNLIILPFRPRKSAEAYEKIWTEAGSPLLVHGRELAARVEETLGGGWRVELAMRYGSPSVAEAVDRLERAGVTRFVLFPLYPQHATATTTTTVEHFVEVLARRGHVPPFAVVPPFYDHPSFVRAFAQVGRPVLEEKRPDHVLMSFHGLPERQVTRLDRTGAHCLGAETCCDAIVEANRHCYRAQCFATARALAAELGIPEDGYTVTFQSRLGRTPWIRPYSDLVIPELARQGKKRLVVFCPAFVTDCLETLEEIGLRGRDSFREAGGEELTLVPSLNAHPAWVGAVAELVRETSAW